jgi:hypothetical protein
MPHTVEFVVDKSESMRAPKDWQWSRKSMHSRPMPRVYAVDYIVDEQGNNVTFATKDAFVQGGGVIHTINAVRHRQLFCCSMALSKAALEQVWFITMHCNLQAPARCTTECCCSELILLAVLLVLCSCSCAVCLAVLQVASSTACSAAIAATAVPVADFCSTVLDCRC